MKYIISLSLLVCYLYISSRQSRKYFNFYFFIPYNFYVRKSVKRKLIKSQNDKQAIIVFKKE